MFQCFLLSSTDEALIRIQQLKGRIEDSVREAERETKQLETERGRRRVNVCSEKPILWILWRKKLKVKLESGTFGLVFK